MAVAHIRRQPWRREGCTDACTSHRVIRSGLLQRVEIIAHDAAAHEAWGRLTAGPLAEALVWTDALVVDRLRRVVTLNGREVNLSEREWGVMDHLGANLGRLCTIDEILTAVWGPEWIGEWHLFRVTLQRLRGKLGDRSVLVENVVGRGYRLRQLPTVGDAYTPPEPAPKRWARGWDCCNVCGGTDRKHDGRGLCSRCREHRRVRGEGQGGGSDE